MHGLVTRLDARPELRLVCYSFERAFGREPEGVWTAPYAVPLAERGLAVAVRWWVVVAAAPRADTVVRLASLNRPAQWLETCLLGAEVPAPDWAGHAYRVLRAAGLPGGADLLVHADLPRSAGLSADCSTACAALMAAAESQGIQLPPDRLAELISNGEPPAVPWAIVGGRPSTAVDGLGDAVPFDPAAEGRRLLLVVTRAGEPDAVQAASALALDGGALRAWPSGGSVIALVPEHRMRAVRAEVTGGFHRDGRRPPRLLTLTVADGARRQA